jgi:CubicO group peptidase (beta-lactamase class C family)
MRIWLLPLFVGSSAAAHGQSAAPPGGAWTIPPDDAIRQVISTRLRIPGAGMVIGVIEPNGRRIVSVGPVDGDTIFRIGSITKTFTTLLLADMVVRGEVSLDDTVAKYLPRRVRMVERGRAIELRDLATHSSGLPSMPTNFALRGHPDPVAAYSARELGRFLSNYSPQSAPGERWAYSNLGVALLGRLLARRAGTDYETLLRTRILEPLGLKSTAITLSRAQASRLAPGLDRYGQPSFEWEMRTLQGSGSLRSSTNDLLEYLAVLLGERQNRLRPAIELQLSTRAPIQPAQALGWGTAKSGGREIFVHDGGKPGYRSLIAFDPANRRGIVMLVNARTDERLGVIAQYLLTGKPLPAPRAAAAPRPRVTVERRAVAGYEGRYRLEDGSVLDIVASHGHLIVDRPGEGPSPFVAETSRIFYDPSGEAELVFEPATVGVPPGLVFLEHGSASTAVMVGRPTGRRR